MFSFLAASHPFRPLLDRFQQSLSANPRVASDESGATRTVHADLKAQPEGENGFRIEAFYWSLQTRDERGFRAATLSFSAKKGEAEWLEFPADPYLSALAQYLAAKDAEGGPPVDILRYVPLRRVTFRAGEVCGTPAVGKFKRRSRFRQAYELLQTVHRTLARASPGFRVSAPIAMEEERSLYFQEALPGRTLADMIAASQSARFLVRLGSLHAALHRASINGLSCWDRHAFLESLRRDGRWIAFLLPERAAGVGRALERIEAAAAAGLKDASAFCHGDPDCTQVLVDGEDWSLLDFDGCQAGDPYRDIAMFLASLDYHVPYYSALAREGSEQAISALDAATAAYLDGYREASGRPVEPARLAWHRACAEVYYLALMLKKNRCHPRAFEGRWQRLQARVQELR